MYGPVGVAISTTGDVRRMKFLETCAREWWKALIHFGLPTVIYVTVDGSEEDVQRAQAATMGFAEVYRVGQKPDHIGRLGVAVNKNTGLELLMDAGGEHLFLCDDDTWPLGPGSLELHTEFDWPHSMVCWGKHRMDQQWVLRADWNWPRGVLLYASRRVVEQVGGMDERFGEGGHEHAEWSRRIYQAGFTPMPFISPSVYAKAERGPAMGAGIYWHAEDMPRKGERLGDFRARKRKFTTITRDEADWNRIHQVMKDREGDASFVPFRAQDNGRASATLCGTHVSETTRAEEPGEQ